MSSSERTIQTDPRPSMSSRLLLASLEQLEYDSAVANTVASERELAELQRQMATEDAKRKIEEELAARNISSSSTGTGDHDDGAATATANVSLESLGIQDPPKDPNSPYSWRRPDSEEQLGRQKPQPQPNQDPQPQPKPAFAQQIWYPPHPPPAVMMSRPPRPVPPRPRPPGPRPPAVQFGGNGAVAEDIVWTAAVTVAAMAAAEFQQQQMSAALPQLVPARPRYIVMPRPRHPTRHMPQTLQQSPQPQPESNSKAKAKAKDDQDDEWEEIEVEEEVEEADLAKELLKLKKSKGSLSPASMKKSVRKVKKKTCKDKASNSRKGRRAQKKSRGSKGQNNSANKGGSNRWNWNSGWSGSGWSEAWSESWSNSSGRATKEKAKAKRAKRAKRRNIGYNRSYCRWARTRTRTGGWKSRR